MTIMMSNNFKRCSFKDAMNLTGLGKHSIAMLITCCFLILAMYLDIFGFSVAMPALACDMGLTSAQHRLLSAIPLVGVMISSYAWGLCADTMGRRTTLLMAMPVGVLFNCAASLAPNLTAMAVLKFISASFTSSANAAGFVLMGESIPNKYRSKFMFYMTMATNMVQFIICVFALPIFKLTCHIEISWLGIDYRPWRLLLQCICIPGIIGCICMIFFKESPKYLLCKGKGDDTLDVLKFIYKLNTGNEKWSFPVESLFLEEVNENSHMSFLRKMWTQTAPLFKAPLLKNSIILYYLLICALMTSTGFTMWVPTITNAYFNSKDASGKTFCDVASSAASSNSSTSTDCDNTIQSLTLYSVMVYSGVSSIFTMGKLVTVMVLLDFSSAFNSVDFVCVACGLPLIFVRVPMLSLALFYVFLYTVLILGNVNTYLIELNPTHLRGMATCLSVVVARGFGFISVQLIASFMGSYCTPMIAGYLLLVVSGLVVSHFLPCDADSNASISTSSTQLADDNLERR